MAKDDVPQQMKTQWQLSASYNLESHILYTSVAHFLHWLLEPVASKILMPRACLISENTFLSGFPVLSLPLLGQHWYHINKVIKPRGGGDSLPSKEQSVFLRCSVETKEEIIKTQLV